MFSEKLKELRKKKGLTQEDLASELNVSRQAITKWESGDGAPDIDNLRNIALFFHVSVDYLIDNKTEQIVDLKNKFNLAEIFLFILGICLGFVAKSFEFGFIMCLLLPGMTICIENIVLSKKYEKENDILSLKELQEKNLPTDLFGIILNTNKESKGKRIKQYLINATLGISIIELFTIIATIFGKDELLTLGLTLVKNTTINTILNFVISFLLGVLVFFILEYIISEMKIRKYNKTRKK
jgi:transcriptional regulator with XRE-family HTH domain